MLNKGQKLPWFIVNLNNIKQPNFMSYDQLIKKFDVLQSRELQAYSIFPIRFRPFKKMAEFQENIRGTLFFLF